MQKLVLALALGAAVALPAIASDEGHRLDEMTIRWEQIADPVVWVDAPITDDSSDAGPTWRPSGVSRAGDGWPVLDGWMRGDPTLRHWVMHRFDIDADGWLSADEAMTARHAFYEIADTNRSELITSEEFVAGWAAVRHELRSFYTVGLDGA